MKFFKCKTCNSDVKDIKEISYLGKFSGKINKELLIELFETENSQLCHEKSLGLEDFELCGPIISSSDE